jgi:16S rRNA (guanine527-N7)-methyltransferase
MDAVRIAELLDPFMGPRTAQRLTPNALAHISIYIDILLRWNARINLTAIRDPEEIVVRHFGESLFAARHLLPKGTGVGTAAPGCPAEQSSTAAGPIDTAGNSKAAPSTEILSPRPLPQARPEPAEAITPRVADIGSGAGFPGFPLKLWAPQISLTLIESNYKKATFLREVVRSLALTNVNINNARAESLTETFDLVSLRAVEDFASILPTAAARVAPGGRLGLLVGAAQIELARSSLPDLCWSDPIPVPLSTSRVVLVGNRLR